MEFILVNGIKKKNAFCVGQFVKKYFGSILKERY